MPNLTPLALLVVPREDFWVFFLLSCVKGCSALKSRSYDLHPSRCDVRKNAIKTVYRDINLGHTAIDMQTFDIDVLVSCKQFQVGEKDKQNIKACKILYINFDPTHFVLPCSPSWPGLAFPTSWLRQCFPRSLHVWERPSLRVMMTKERHLRKSLDDAILEMALDPDRPFQLGRKKSHRKELRLYRSSWSQWHQMQNCTNLTYRHTVWDL